MPYAIILIVQVSILYLAVFKLIYKCKDLYDLVESIESRLNQRLLSERLYFLDDINKKAIYDAKEIN